LFILCSEGKLPDSQGKDSFYHPTDEATISWYNAEARPYEDKKPEFGPDFGDEPLTNEMALNVLFGLAWSGEASSELVVERTMGSFLHLAFLGIGKTTTTTRSVGYSSTVPCMS
jgi:hypothetical protein